MEAASPPQPSGPVGGGPRGGTEPDGPLPTASRSICLVGSCLQPTSTGIARSGDEMSVRGF
jgi:hypothetical protein